MFLLILALLLQPQLNATQETEGGGSPYAKYIVAINQYDCLLQHDPENKIELAQLLDYAVHQGFTSIRIAGGDWDVHEPIVLKNSGIQIRQDPLDEQPYLHGGVILSLQNVTDVSVEGIQFEGTVEMQNTENVSLQGLTFIHGGIRMKAQRCNQPNECTNYNRNVRVENSLFVDCEKGIYAERLENAFIIGNRFTGDGNAQSCERTVGIEIDGSNEDLDRPLELGHTKANRIEQNIFEQVFATGVRIRDSNANLLRDNIFNYSFRAVELLDGARYNQIYSSHIGYLAQFSTPSTCHAPCALYVGPGTLNNLFLNNFFEQNFEIKYLEQHRNNVFIIDESGKTNVFRSDFLP
jgi:hypothetical protein